MPRLASALIPLMLCPFCPGGIAGLAADESTGAAVESAAVESAAVVVQKPWGRIGFCKGFPSSLILDLGSRTDLIAASAREKEYGEIEYSEDGKLYSTFEDGRMECSREKDTLVFRGRLRDPQGAVSRHEASYTLTWTVSDLGEVSRMCATG